MAGGRGRGRSRATATPSDPSPSTNIGATGVSPSPSPSASAPSTAPSTTVGGRRACESCEAAPGMPFCRVEWSFLCASCGPALHRNSWIVAVPPIPGPGPGPGQNPPTGTGSDASQVPPPYYFPPFMQMPHMPPMHTQFQMPMPMHPNNPSTTTGMAGKKRRRRPRVVPASKEQMPAHVPADTDSDPEAVQAENEGVVRHGMKRNAKSPPSPSTRTDTGDAYAELHPGVEETMLTNMPESAQVDAIENLAAEMEPPPTEVTELDETEHVIEEQEQQ